MITITNKSMLTNKLSLYNLNNLIELNLSNNFIHIIP